MAVVVKTLLCLGLLLIPDRQIVWVLQEEVGNTYLGLKRFCMQVVVLLHG